MQSVKDDFIKRFGVKEAEAIERAAESHGNGINDRRRGDDPFKWALCICIGYQCMEISSYREFHEIRSPWDEIKSWIKDYAHIGTHNGDVDYLSLLIGKYKEYMPAKPGEGVTDD